MSNRQSGPQKRPPNPGRQARVRAARAGARRRQRVRYGVVGLGAGIVVVVAVLSLSGSGGGAGVTDPTRFDLPALNGPGRVQLAAFRGKPVVVNFFASWCSACDFELPGFAKASRALRDKVTFVGVASLETGDRNFMPKRHGITWWPLAKDVGGAQGSGLHDALGGGSSMPLTAFYDANGKVLEVERAALPETTLVAKLKQFYGVEL